MSSSTLTTTTSSRTSAIISVSPVPTFSCPRDGFLIQSNQVNGTSLYTVNIATGATTLVNYRLGDGTLLNGLGYNVLDNRLYAITYTTTNPQLVVIGAGGALSVIRSLPAQAAQYNAGDVDEAGQFWGAYQGRGIVQVNLEDPSYPIVYNGAATPQYSLYDWAYVPGGGNYLYSVTSNSAAADNAEPVYLLRFDRTAKSWATVGTFGVLVTSNANTWGAVYASADGLLYGSENNSGRIFRFNITSLTATSLAAGPSSNVNDGAHWYVSILLVEPATNNDAQYSKWDIDVIAKITQPRLAAPYHRFRRIRGWSC